MRRTHNSLINPVLGCAAMAVALYAILFSSVRHFSIEDAERTLSEFASYFNIESNHGREARLQYSTIEMRGFAYDKWAHITKLSLDFIYQQWQGGTRLGLSTNQADMIPDHANPDRIVLRLNDPINVIASSELLATLTPAKPIIYAIAHKPTQAPETIRHQMMIPSNVTITTIDPKREMMLELPTPIRIDTNVFPSQRQLRSKLMSGVIRLVTGGDVWSMENADIRYDATRKGASIMESRGTLTIDRLAFSQGAVKTTPYTATAAWTMREQHNISGETDAIQMTIDHGLITDGNVKLSINGEMHMDLDDAPYGELVFEITRPDDLIASNWIVESKKAAAHALLDEIMGEKTESHKQAIINIVREKNGAWRVGKLPLQTLLDKGFFSLFIFGGTSHVEKTQPATS